MTALTKDMLLTEKVVFAPETEGQLDELLDLLGKINIRFFGMVGPVTRRGCLDSRVLVAEGLLYYNPAYGKGIDHVATLGELRDLIHPQEIMIDGVTYVKKAA